jgi:hypothetical protein
MVLEPVMPVTASQLGIDLAPCPDFTQLMRLLVPVLMLLALVGCAHHRPASASSAASAAVTATASTNVFTDFKPKLIITPERSLTGKVVKVNKSAQFVVLNFPIGRMPAPEQNLSVYHLGLKTGEVKVTGPQMDDNIVGDLVAGDAMAGDEVRE